MPEPTIELFARILGQALRPHDFARLEGVSAPPPNVELRAIWRRRRRFGNHGVALAVLPEGESHAGDYAQAIKTPVGALVGYVPYLYTLGLQLVLVTRRELPKTVLDSVDTHDTHRVLLQSIQVVNLEQRVHVWGRAWHAGVVADFQKAIVSALNYTVNL